MKIILNKYLGYTFIFFLLVGMVFILTFFFYIKNNDFALVNSSSGKIIEDNKMLYLSGAWYYRDNDISMDERTFMLSGDHFTFAISFEIKSKKKLFQECRENIKDISHQWSFLCNSKGDDLLLQKMFDGINGNIILPEKDLIKLLSSGYSRVHNAKYISPGKVIFTMGSVQDAVAIFPVYLSKINDNDYLEIRAYPDIICDKDIICKGKIPILDISMGLDPYWNFIWSGVIDGNFYDPVIKETYDQMFLVEKNWQSITNNAIAW